MYIHLDFETRSGADLVEYGADVHLSHPWADIWCLGYAYADYPVCISWPGDPDFLRILRTIDASTAPIVAHNAQFEWQVWNALLTRKYGVAPLPIERFRCTMAAGYAMALPGSLDNLAGALGLTERKDLAGSRLAVQMSRPRAIVDGVPTWWDEPEKLSRLYHYCQQDVRVEREVHKRLRPLPDSEQRLWCLDAKINMRGVYIDAQAGAAALNIVEREQTIENAKIWHITQGEINGPSEVKRLTDWVRARGVDIPGVAKQDLVDTLALDGIPPLVREVLEIRQTFAKTSTAKIDKMLSNRSADGRLKGLLQYHGSSTGRWAGRRVQPHNLPRPVIKQKEIDAILDALVSMGDAAGQYIRIFHGPPLARVADCLRGLLCAAPGHTLFAGDFANIEGRVLAWLAGEESKLEAFRAFDAKTGPDVYLVTAARIYHKSVTSLTKESPERQIGKVAELACLGPETKVLTSNGVKAIVDVTKIDWLWDGVEWVRHEGVICNGMKRTINVAGIRLTPDHLVLTGRTWTPARQLDSNENTLYRALETGSASLPLSDWIQPKPELCPRWSGLRVRAGRNRTESMTGIYEKDAALVATVVRKSSLDTPERITRGTPALLSLTIIGGGCSTESLHVSIDVETRMMPGLKTTVGEGLWFTPNGLKIENRFCCTLRSCQGGIRQNWNSIELMLIRGMSQGTYGFCRKPQIKPTEGLYNPCSNDSRSLSPVYDLVNAGPRNRFTVLSDTGPLIVHNCGYQGGVGAFQTMAKTYGVKVGDAEAESIKVAWREAHPRIKQYWYDVERAAVQAIEHPGVITTAGPSVSRVMFRMNGSFLWCALPSGRALCYPYPSLRDYESQRGPKKEIRYKSVDAYTRQWSDTGTYGGKLVENITQAVSRDFLAEALTRLDHAGWAVVLHVHDEIVSEMRAGNLDDYCALMKQSPAWAPGLPIAVEGWTGRRYRK